MRPSLYPVALAVALAVGASTASASAAFPHSDPAASATVPASQSTSTSAIPAAVEPDGNGIAVDVVPSSGGRLAPGSDLTVTVTITNTSSERLPAGDVELLVSPGEASSPDELTTWLQATGPADAAALGPVVIEVPTPGVVAGGSARLPPITVPATALPITATTGFGVHRLTARVAAGEIDSTGTSAITVDPGGGVPATRLALAMPLTVPTEAGGVISEDLLEAYTAEGGTLSRQLNEAAGRSVAIGIDPRIIASIRLLGQTAPPSALEWLDRLAALPNETLPLAYADSDISGTSQAGAGVLAPTAFAVDPARFPAAGDAGPEEDDGEETDGQETGGGEVDGEADPSEGPTEDPTPSPSTVEPALPTTEDLLDWDYTRADLAWPRDGSVVAADLDTFAAAGMTTSIVSSANAGDPTSASARTGTHPILVSNDAVSTLLRDAVAAPSYSDWQSAMARLSASLAVLADSGEAAEGVVLATLDRRGPEAGYQLSATLGALAGTSWSAPASLGDAASGPPVPTAITDSPVSAERLNALGVAVGLEGSIAQFATAVDDPTRLTGERRLALLALSSQTWTANEADWGAAVTGFVERSNDVLSSVQVASTVLAQWSDNGALPLVITNSLPYPVTVNVNVRASSAILEVTQPDVQLSIPADSQKRALVPVESIANGEVRLVVTLTSLTGIGVGAPASVAVTVNAGWETTATVVLAILVVAVFVLGVVRTIRRRRRLLAGEAEATDETDEASETREAGEARGTREAGGTRTPSDTREAGGTRERGEAKQ